MGASTDDEYFRLVVSIRHDVDHPDAVQARHSAMRSLTRRETRGLMTAFVRTMRDAEVRTPAGLYLGRLGSYQIDAARLWRVARRVTLGLFYRDIGRRLRRGYDATTYLPAAFDEQGTAAYQEMAAPMVRTLLGEAPQFVGRRVPSYWSKAAQEDPNVGLWLLQFYGKVAFVSITAPMAATEEDSAGPRPSVDTQIRP